MDLAVGKLLWPDISPPPPVSPPLTEDTSCDVLIIGGGIAGALCAYYLAKLDIDTVIVEKRTIASGSTAANAGHLQFANDKSLTSCIHSFGEKDGVRFYQLCRQALDELESICSVLGIEAEFRRRCNLYAASEPKDVEALKQEFHTLRTYGFSVQYWEAEQIARHYSFHRPGAIFSSGDAEINPYRLTSELISVLKRSGVRVYEHTEVVSHKTGTPPLVFTTRERRTITAARAVVASGYEALQVKRHPNAVMESTYAIATEPLSDFPGWYEQSLIWETARPYLYLRTTPDRRIIAGGLDENTKIPEERDALLPSKSKRLLEEISRMFPALTGLRADYYWSAPYATTHDGLPLIGEREDLPHCYFALGYGGNGTVYSTIAAQIISGIIARGAHPDADLFRLDRPAR
ncbi:NAD(P)/FAD-dependent oxidoreductase [Paenibacillus sp. NPDC056579]|uniref:NAD(P)/FAD-dependent oxidoreductase n=1 Tax=Paenibacillus sp. NPDC056579 TaxID=3345871 RepID=UPI0036B44637